MLPDLVERFVCVYMFTLMWNIGSVKIGGSPCAGPFVDYFVVEVSGYTEILLESSTRGSEIPLGLIGNRGPCEQCFIIATLHSSRDNIFL